MVWQKHEQKMMGERGETGEAGLMDRKKDYCDEDLGTWC